MHSIHSDNVSPVLISKGKAKNAAWTDLDLALSLSCTFRWGGKSIWLHPLSAAQHALTVLALSAKSATVPLSRAQALRELLHDAAVPSTDKPAEISSLKSFHGKSFPDLAARQQVEIFSRYRLVQWTPAEFDRHKYVDILAAASEAVHVVGWASSEIQDLLTVGLTPLAEDPLAAIYDCRPWEPWSPQVSAERFLEKLTEQGGAPAAVQQKTAVM